MKSVVTHCAWLPERKATLERLLDRVMGHDVTVLRSRGREHAAIWARRLWEWCADQDQHVVCLNDDVILHPDFVRICEAIIDAVPDEPISLHTSVPGAAEHRDGPWVRSYWLTGPAYIFPPGYAAKLLAWVYARDWHWLARTNEDNLAIHFAWEQQAPFLQAVPAPVTHDTTVKSSLGYDHHAHRVPSVPWEGSGADLTSPSYWKPGDVTPWVPNPWMPVEKLDYMRRVMAAGKAFCFVCTMREAVVGAVGGPGLCNHCVAQCYAASIRGESP